MSNRIQFLSLVSCSHHINTVQWTHVRNPMYNTHDATNSLKKGRDYISQYKRYVITYAIGNEFTGFLQIKQCYFSKTVTKCLPSEGYVLLCIHYQTSFVHMKSSHSNFNVTLYPPFKFSWVSSFTPQNTFQPSIYTQAYSIVGIQIYITMDMFTLTLNI